MQIHTVEMFLEKAKLFLSPEMQGEYLIQDPAHLLYVFLHSQDVYIQVEHFFRCVRVPFFVNYSEMLTVLGSLL